MKHIDLEQCKKLRDLGLNPDTADMSYDYDFDDGAYYACLIPFNKWNIPKYAKSDKIEEVIPCWSLDALISIVWRRGVTATTCVHLYEDVPGNGWYCHCDGMPYETVSFSSPTDAVYDYLVWLLKTHPKRFVEQ